jgi:DNA-binding transcriptional MerR regulator
MTIGQLSETTGVPASTIRYYERIGLLPEPVRVSGKRRYWPDAVHRLAALRLAQACGFRLDEMRQLLRGSGASIPPPRRWRTLAGQKRAELDAQMARLRAMRRLVDRVVECRCVEMSDCGRIAYSLMESTAR